MGHPCVYDITRNKAGNEIEIAAFLSRTTRKQRHRLSVFTRGKTEHFKAYALSDSCYHRNILYVGAVGIVSTFAARYQPAQTVHIHYKVVVAVTHHGTCLKQCVVIDRLFKHVVRIKATPHEDEAVEKFTKK